jgi:hypothetical protein
MGASSAMLGVREFIEKLQSRLSFSEKLMKY